MNKLLIFYLTANDRHFIFRRFAEEISKSKHKERFKLLIVNSAEDSSYYNNYLETLEDKIDYECVSVPCEKANYMPKVHFAIDYAKANKFKYILKLDNDIIMPLYTLDFILNNLSHLDSNLTLSPTISTGIPSVEYFIDELFNKEEASKIREEFKRCQFFPQPGIFNYSFLNSSTIESPEEKWDTNKYFSTLKNHMDQFPNNWYKGIHPIRHGFGNELINELIIKHRDSFFKAKSCKIKEDDKPYLCDMCFAINTDVYDEIINKENLGVDGCDEVPLNRYSWKYNKNHSIISNGFTIHITYNWRWHLNTRDGGSNITPPTEGLLEYERAFIDKLYK